MSQFKIAWGITGAGHLLRESVEQLVKLVKEGKRIDLFISNAGETVLKMYKLINTISDLHQTNKDQLKRLIFERDQIPGFPISAKFNLHSYDLLVLSPLSANSVAKMNVGIADNLMTNIFSQMIKGSGLIYIVPCDLIPGLIQTETPGGKSVEITIDNFNSQNARNLRKFPKVTLFENPSDLSKAINEIWHKE
ncbi:MAG: flavoprotein [Promethearchaeota archaeon]